MEKYVLGEGRKKNEKATKMKKEIEVLTILKSTRKKEEEEEDEEKDEEVA